MAPGGAGMCQIGIWPNLDKEGALKITRELVDWLSGRDCRPWLPADVAGAIGRDDLGAPDLKWAAEVDFVVALGGDGTLLQAAKEMASLAKPVLGVNLGHLGFLTEVEVRDLFPALSSILRGEYIIEERMMLEAEVVHEGESVKRFLALNDVVVAKDSFARMMLVETYIDDTLAASYPADGLIISSPTGSTAYSLSAGGPVVNPKVDVIIITPICPHTFYARSMVVAEDERIRVQIFTSHKQGMLTVDGQIGFELRPEDTVYVQKATLKARLIRRPGWSFYDVLRKKLAAGGS